ncbi:MAG: right-handed parallel beta-helix repeat-containing protein [Bacteroidales bacterium]|nr:right-handed parallel beta-helix repeat-containing protein [Bacteroidales bacterium]
MKNNIITPLVIIFTLAYISLVQAQKAEHKIFDITSFGANGDAKTVNTEFINNAIAACAKAGGGTVVIPKGIFLTGTVVMKSNVHLYLEEGATLQGVNDLSAYQSYIPISDMPNHRLAYRQWWTRGLILATGVTNTSISGKGLIDGGHVEDQKGEEGKRGPHAIVFGECRNYEISGITITRASNYAFLSYESENATFHNLTMTQGFDGIHIRGGKNIIIHDCKFYTGDDAIAGGYWENVSVSNCYINTACNGFRILFPVTDLTIDNCEFQGPGLYPQRSTFDGRRRNMLAAIIIQPGAWGASPGPAEKIHIHDIRIDSMDAAVAFILQNNYGNYGKDILVEKVHATNIVKACYSVESWKGGQFENVTFRDIYTEFKGSDDTLSIENRPSGLETYKRPYWGFFGHNIKDILLENIVFKYTGTEVRPAMGFDDVETVYLKEVNTQKVKGKNAIVLVDCGRLIEE